MKFCKLFNPSQKNVPLINNDVLYTFISCKKNINNYEVISTMMKNLNCDNYIFIIGGFSENIYDKKTKILKLNCNDNYEGLPEKTIKSYKFIYEHNELKKYSHIIKLDDDMILIKLIDHTLTFDYGGYISPTDGSEIFRDRKWHIGRCSKDSKFNMEPYKGIYVPYCLGGNGYILSKKSIEILISDKKYFDEIYEDLYVGKVLKNNKIYPKNIVNLDDYFISPDHTYKIIHLVYLLILKILYLVRRDESTFIRI